MELRAVVVVEDPCDAARAEPASVPATEQVANRPIAHHVLDELEAAGIAEIVVATSERWAEQVRACVANRRASPGARLQFVSHRGPVQLASALALAAPRVGQAPCIVHAAAGLLGEPLTPLAAALEGGPDAILTVHRMPSADERLSAAAQSLLHLAELDPTRPALGAAGVWAFGPGALQSITGGEFGGQAPDTAGVTDRGSDLAVVAERINAVGGTIDVRLADAWRSYHGQAADLLELNRLVLDRIGADLPPGVTDGNRIEGRVHVHETATVTDSVLVGPVVIGRDARISDAYVGPYTAIGAGCRIEGAEIERSIVSPGARVSHVGSRITDSVVGPGAHLFRDFSVPRALRVRVGADAELGLC
jgi:glucose-1-phosphate thymidylyltransferase